MFELLRTLTLGAGGLLVLFILGFSMFSMDWSFDTSWMEFSDWAMIIGFSVFSFLITWKCMD